MTGMGDDLDELGRRLWPATDALRPAGATQGSGGGGGGRRRRFEPLVTLAAAVLLIGVIGGAVLLGRSLSSGKPAPSGPTPTPPVSATSPSPSASISPSPSPTAAATPTPHVIVWAAAGPTSTAIRVGEASGGFHTVATIPTTRNYAVLGSGGHRVLFSQESNGHLYDLDINSGTITDRGGASGDRFFGAAFSPDGTQVEYLRLTASGTGQVRLLDFGSGAITGLQSFSRDPMDVPEVWTAAGVAATGLNLPINEGIGAGFAMLDPSTGARIATTDAQVRTWSIAADGVHAAHSEAVPPGPPDPGVLDTEVIGSAAQVAVREDTNHRIRVLAVSPDGSSVVFSDDPTMGGFAGISLSSDYGLFTVSGGHRTQVAHYGGAPGDYLSGAYLKATDFVVVTGEGALLRSTGGGPLAPLDTGTETDIYQSVWVVTGQ
jgi:hypothetical protein